MLPTVSVDNIVGVSCPTVDSAATAALPSSVFGSTHEICPRIPAALLTRTPEYHGSPVDKTLWWHRHRDMPAIFRQATYLWTEEQRAAVDNLWPPGWHRDEYHPLLKSMGTVRLSSSFKASGIHFQREISVRTAVSDEGVFCAGRSYVLCDLSLTSTRNPAVAELAAPLTHGPLLFQSHNLLQSVAPRSNEHADHAILQMLIGTYGSFTAVHSDWYGADGYLQLQQGEKIWYLAPPEHEAEFRRLLDGDAATGNSSGTRKTVCVSRSSKAHTDALIRSGVHVIHQRAGDVVFVPGGWLHAVKNLTDTVAFGGNYLRGWKLPALIRWARIAGAHSVSSATTPVNVAGIFRLVEQALVDPFAAAADREPKDREQAIRAAAQAVAAARRDLAMSVDEIAAVYDEWKQCAALRSTMPRPAPAAAAATALSTSAADGTMSYARPMSARQLCIATRPPMAMIK